MTMNGMQSQCAVQYPGASPPEFLLHENRQGPLGEPFTERHLHAVWYDPALRPKPLYSADGVEIDVVRPGTWNGGPGPDFLGTAIRLGPSRRLVTGDCELHIHPSGWMQHGHRHDPRYTGVCVHVTYHPGSLETGQLPDPCVEIALRPLLEQNPHFSFDAIDTLAYPYSARRESPPCADRLRAWSPDEVGRFLEAAGLERQRRRRERMRRLIAERGPGQALYEETLAGLGYRHNAGACRSLAGRLPVRVLRTAAQGDDLTACALLYGVAGLLPAQPNPAWDRETRTWFRSLWDRWWKAGGALAPAAIDPAEWRTDSMRPVNQPMRRLRAASLLFTRDPTPEHFLAGISARSPEQLPREAAAWLGTLQCSYWDTRLGSHGPRREGSTALVGATRAGELVLNAWLPYAQAVGHLPVGEPAWPAQAGQCGDNRVVRNTAHWLLGRDHSRNLYASPLRRQGLLQLFEDFCLQDRSGCTKCGLPDWLASRPQDGDDGSTPD